mmetsp:Transcript_84539/g.149695  ORF Transcript_84539/g.149695 Transcript_84539/m.149695 type:complete len:257 (-) Transcript_84539:3756-4526(-)
MMSSRIGVPRASASFKATSSTSCRFSASSFSSSFRSSASGIPSLAASWAESVQAWMACSSFVAHIFTSSGPKGFPPSTSFASCTAIAKERSAANAILMSDTSSKMLGSIRGTRFFAASAASCKRRNRPSADSSVISSASCLAMRSSSSILTYSQSSLCSSSSFAKALFTSSKGAPAIRACTKAFLMSSPAERGFSTASERASTVASYSVFACSACSTSSLLKPFATWASAFLITSGNMNAFLSTARRTFSMSSVAR